MPAPAARPLLVTTSPEEARRETGAGRDVVLIVPPGATGHSVWGGPGRVHRFVGDPTDPGVGPAAAEMAAELGGGGPRPRERGAGERGAGGPGAGEPGGVEGAGPPSGTYVDVNSANARTDR